MLYFFFQAEDGIRDYKVTGVQTCALPIFGYNLVKLGFVPEIELTKTLAKQYKMPAVDLSKFAVDAKIAKLIPAEMALKNLRSEERRVGKECRSWCVADYAGDNTGNARARR